MTQREERLAKLLDSGRKGYGMTVQATDVSILLRYAVGLESENERLREEVRTAPQWVRTYWREKCEQAEARTRTLVAALEAIRRRILRDDPEDVKAEIASGRTINDVYMIAKAALTEPAKPDIYQQALKFMRHATGQDAPAPSQGEQG